jgi:hypothetical protein
MYCLRRDFTFGGLLRRLRFMAIAVSVFAAASMGAAAPVLATTAGTAVAAWHLSYRGPAGNEIDGITAPSRNDAWAYAWRYAKNGNLVGDFYLHWNGRSWRQVTIAAAKGFQPGAIGASSPDNIWLTGSRGRGAQAQGAALVYNGSAWKIISAPWPGNQLDVVTSTDVWMLQGDASGCGTGHSCTSTFDHWNGAIWQAYSFPDDLGLVGAGTRPWLVGTASGNARRQAVYRWNGSNWLRQSAPGRAAAQIVAVAAPGTRLWVAAEARSSGPWRLFELTGTQWSKLRTPGDFAPATAGWPVYDGRDGFWDGQYHWTGMRWLNTTPGTPSQPRWLNSFWYENQAPVPGTSSVWAAVLVNGQNGFTLGGIAVFGATP